MKFLRNIAIALGAALLLTTPAAAEDVIPAGFESRMIDTGDVSLHAVMEDGSGDAVILLHGWPQNWSEWRHVMPQLATDYRVIAIDLRGVGQSEAPAEGYDKATLARDVVGLLDALDIEQAHIVGHDIGGMTAFSFAANHPARAISVTIADVPLPGIPSFEIIDADPRSWHFGFHATPHLPEAVITGDQTAYFQHFYDALSINKAAFTDADVERFAAAYAAPERLSAGFNFYRNFAVDAEALTAASLERAPRLLLLNGEGSMAGLAPMMSAELSAKGAERVFTLSIPGAGHWIAEENPEAVATALIDFFENRLSVE